MRKLIALTLTAAFVGHLLAVAEPTYAAERLAFALPTPPTQEASAATTDQLQAQDLPFLSSWPSQLVLAARRFVAEKLTANPTVSAETEAKEDVAAVTAVNPPEAAAMPPEKIVATSAEAGSSMGDFWRLAWSKTKPLLAKGWRLSAAIVTGFFSELWTPNPTATENANVAAPTTDVP